MGSKREGIALLAILAVGAALRLAWLGEPSLWYDEVAQARLALADSIRTVFAYFPLNKPPLFYVVEFLVGRVSPSEWALRIPSCIAGTATIWAMWRLARRLSRDAGIAILAAALLAVSPLHVTYSQEARPYALGLLFSLLAVDAMFAQLERPAIARVLRLALWIALSCWTFYFGLGLTIVQALWVGGLACVRPAGGSTDLSARRRAVAGFFLALGLALLLTVPLLLRVYQASAEETDPWNEAPVLGIPLVARIAAALAFGNNERTVGSIAVVLLTCAALGAVDFWRRSRGTALFLLVWLLLMQGTQVVLYVWHEHWISSHYHLIYLPPLMLFCAAGIHLLLGKARLRGPGRSAILFSILLVLGAASLAPLAARRAWKGDLRSAVRELAGVAKPTDAVMGSSEAVNDAYVYYRNRLWAVGPDPCYGRQLAKTLTRIGNAKTLWLLSQASCYPANHPFFRRIDPAGPQKLTPQVVVRSVPARIVALDDLLVIDAAKDQWERMRIVLPFDVQIGEPSAAAHVGDLWGWPEDWGGKMVRWMFGHDSEIYFRISDKRPSSVAVTAHPFRGEGFPKQNVSLWWDDRLLTSATLTETAFATIEAPIPADAWTSGPLHVLRISCDRSVRSESFPLPNDTRDLSVAVHRIRLE